MTRPVVSVVMSVYNGADDLHRAVSSILNQTFGDFEFIIVDDGSSDRTPEILREFANRDSRIRVVTQENLGLTKALIHGCELSVGKYIARQDADDISMPDRFQKQVDLLESNSDVVLASCFAEYRGPKNELLMVVTRETDPEKATPQLLNEKQGPPAHGSTMFRRDSYFHVGGYRSEFYYGQDADLWLRMCEHGLVGFVGEVLYRYSFQPGNISGAHEHYQAAFGRIGQECRSARRDGRSEHFILEQGARLAEEVRAKRIRKQQVNNNKSKANFFIGSLLAGQRDRRALEYLRESIRENPLNYRAWIRLAEAFVRCRSVHSD